LLPQFVFKEIFVDGHQWLTCNQELQVEGGRDQENNSSKPAMGKLFWRPYLENSQHKKGLVEWLK
jgi:hypothetical protein